MTATSVVVLGQGVPGLSEYLADAPVGHVATPADLAGLLAGVPGDVLLLDPGVGCSGSYPIADVLAPGPSRVLLSQTGSAQVRVAGGVVVSAGTSQAALEDCDALACGCLRVCADDRPALDAVLAELDAGPPGRLWERLLSVLVMRGVVVKPVDPAGFVVAGAEVAPDPDPVATQARRCARGGDGWLSERTVRPVSRRVTPWAVRLGLAPNLITVFSLLVGAGAVAAALIGTRWGYLLTGILMLVSLVLDCVDGEVARWTHRYSRSGAWLDAVGDRVKEYAIWFAVAWSVGADGLWLLVLACLVLFTAKHFLDYGWSLRHPQWRAQVLPVSAGPDPWARAGAVPAKVRPPSWRRILGMPIAERWMLVAVLLPLTGPWVTFAVLALLGALSLTYTVLTRIRWSHGPISEDTRPQLQALTDPGPLLLAMRPDRVGLSAAAAAGLVVLLAGALTGGWYVAVAYLVALGLYALAYGPGPRGRLGWMAPSVARVTEMLGLIALAYPAGPWVPVFAILAAVAWRHYDVIYRIRNQQMLPDRTAWLLLLGTEGRILVAMVLLSVFGVGAWLWFALYVAVVAVADSVISWFRG